MDIAKLGGRITAALLLLTGGAHAGEIHRWVDENGVVHFSDAQFAPKDTQIVTVGKANGMDAADTSVLHQGPDQASVVTLGRGNVTNKRGWRGSKYDGRSRKGLGARDAR